jgi:hypothetical protein
MRAAHRGRSLTDWPDNHSGGDSVIDVSRLSGGPRRGSLQRLLILLVAFGLGYRSPPAHPTTAWVDQAGSSRPSLQVPAGDRVPRWPAAMVNTANAATPSQPRSPGDSGRTCLDQAGSVITVTGRQWARYSNTRLMPGTTIDASAGLWLGVGKHPITIGGGPDICWHGGLVHSNYPRDLDWATFHGTAGLDVVSAASVVVESVRIIGYGDGIQLREGTERFTIRGVYLHDLHDDCVEGDWLPGGLIEDSFFDGCYYAFAARPPAKDVTSDGRHRIWEIQNSLAYVRPQTGVYKGSASPGNGGFFKWDNSPRRRSPGVAIHNTTLRIDQRTSFSVVGMWVQPEKLVSCSNVTLVWLGPGPYPVSLPDCVTLTSDLSVWERAVADWKARHPAVVP